MEVQREPTALWIRVSEAAARKAPLYNVSNLKMGVGFSQLKTAP